MPEKDFTAEVSCKLTTREGFLNDVTQIWFPPTEKNRILLCHSEEIFQLFGANRKLGIVRPLSLVKSCS